MEEDVIWFGKPTVFSFSSLFAGAILGVISIAALEGFLAPTFSWIPTLGLGGLGVGLLILDFAFNRARSTIYVISAVGVRRECHYVTDEFNELPFDRVADVVVSQGVLGRIFRFGSVTARSGSVSFQSVQFKGIRQPEEVRRIVLDARNKALAK